MDADRSRRRPSRVVARRRPRPTTGSPNAGPRLERRRDRERAPARRQRREESQPSTAASATARHDGDGDEPASHRRPPAGRGAARPSRGTCASTASRLARVEQHRVERRARRTRRAARRARARSRSRRARASRRVSRTSSTGPLRGSASGSTSGPTRGKLCSHVGILDHDGHELPAARASRTRQTAGRRRLEEVRDDEHERARREPAAERGEERRAPRASESSGAS